MAQLQELRAEALALSDAKRAALASDLLQTLPAILSDEDDGIAEALRRDAELDRDPTLAVSWETIKKGLGR